MRRYASIDFLRGLAIFLMLFLHVVNHVLDVGDILVNLNDVPLINTMVFAILPYLGGLAGFFLIVSAIGNMISMYRHLQRGNSVNSLIVKQVVGGCILLAFAMLTEGVIGYWGAVGEVFLSLDKVDLYWWLPALYRGYKFETIHTIAWCIIVNGLVQGVLSRHERWKKPALLIKIYAVLAVAVLASTQFLWDMASAITTALGNPGYPHGSDPLLGNGEPVLGLSPWYDHVLYFFLNPIAGAPEPIFPYLAASFIGSIIGIVLSQPRESIPRDFPRKMLWVGLTMFLVGTVYIILFFVVQLAGGVSFGTLADMYRNIWDHHYWTPEHGFWPLAWVFQFVSLNGFAIMATMLVIKLVEFRGNGAQFAKKTAFIRRFGFIAFTNYAFQWLYYIAWFLVTLLFYANPYKLIDWGGTVITWVLTLGFYEGMMLLWERVRYTGSIEWCVSALGNLLIPAKRGRKEGAKRWWQAAQLDVDGSFYHAEWLDVVEKSEIATKNMRESKLACKLALIGLVSLLFTPFCFVTLQLSRTAEIMEGKNRYNTMARTVSIIGICVLIAVIGVFWAFTPNDLGIGF
nr:heparan-alpha-glucosaminide N-acetyltransferase domain-containing protein [Candidatus Sigynarchaeota archaeon]